MAWLGDRQLELLTRKGCQSNPFDQLVLVIAEHTEKVHHLAIEIIICFYRGRQPVNQHRRRASKRLTVVLRSWQQWQQPIKMAIFPTVPPKSDHSSHHLTAYYSV